MLVFYKDQVQVHEENAVFDVTGVMFVQVDNRGTTPLFYGNRNDEQIKINPNFGRKFGIDGAEMKGDKSIKFQGEGKNEAVILLESKILICE